MTNEHYEANQLIHINSHAVEVRYYKRLQVFVELWKSALKMKFVWCQGFVLKKSYSRGQYKSKGKFHFHLIDPKQRLRFPSNARKSCR